MRAVVHDKYGPPEVLRLEVVERPEPKDDEVLVKVHATTVNRTDCHLRGANPFLWRLFGAGLCARSSECLAAISQGKSLRWAQP